jgi:hypothetical protein
MSTNFKIEFRTSNGNLHLQPKGDFDGSAACELVNLIHDKYEGEGRVFVDTQRLRTVHPFGCSMFHYHLNFGKLPANRLYFKGEKGFEMAPDGSRVLVTSEKKCRHQCRGNCATCKCGSHQKRFRKNSRKRPVKELDKSNPA